MSPLRDTGQPIEIYDVDASRLLARAQEAGCDGDDDCRTISCIEGNGTLLTYYFGRGKRDVVVRSGPNEGTTAQLGTRWRAGHREWTLN